MKELRKLINKEVRKALTENYRDAKENVAILHAMLTKGGKDAQRAKEIIKDIKDELSIVMSTFDPKANLKLVNKVPELDEYLDSAVEDALDDGMGRMRGMMGGMQGMREASVVPTDMAKIKDFVMSSPQFERLSTSKIKAAVKDMYDEWKASASNYKNIEAYFKEMEEMGDDQAFMENKMSKTKKMVKRLKEDTEYQEFFKKAMTKFNINTPADLKDPIRKKEFFDYIDKNYKSKSEMNEGTYLMSNPSIKAKVDKVIEILIGIDVDGETMQYILEAVGMDEQMQHQLTPGGIR